MYLLYSSDNTDVHIKVFYTCVHICSLSLSSNDNFRNLSAALLKAVQSHVEAAVGRPAPGGF